MGSFSRFSLPRLVIFHLLTYPRAHSPCLSQVDLFPEEAADLPGVVDQNEDGNADDDGHMLEEEHADDVAGQPNVEDVSSISCE